METTLTGLPAMATVTYTAVPATNAGRKASSRYHPATG
jgi:hypothetical protein